MAETLEEKYKRTGKLTVSKAPSESGIDYRKKHIIWTSSDYDTNNDDVINGLPFIELQGYEQQYTQLLSSFNNWVRVVGTQQTYRNIYTASKVISSHYRLPFFMENHHQVNQNWNEYEPGEIEKTVKKVAEFVGKLITPAAGIIQPQVYGGPGDYAYDVRFQLINTLSEKGMQDNKKFIDRFLKENLHLRSGTLCVFPPYFYSAYIPGIRWSPVCAVTNLTISNKGTLNYIDSLGCIVPDIWEIHLQIKELISESRDLYSAAIKGGILGDVPDRCRVFIK